MNKLEQMRTWRRSTYHLGAAAACIGFLAGCAALQSSTIRASLLDYGNVIEETVDKLLLTNVLEARDNAPLHFIEFPKVNGNLQETASVKADIPFVARTFGSPNVLATTTITPTIGVQSTPTFEVDNLDTKDFVTGMTSPIDPKYVKYWIDRGLDKRIILLLFVSSAQITRTKPGMPQIITVRNNPRASANEIIACLDEENPKWKDIEKEHPDDTRPTECHARTQFDFFLKLIDKIQNELAANAYSERTLVFQTTGPLALKDIAALDPSKQALEYTGSSYKLFTLSGTQKIALCLQHQGQPQQVIATATATATTASPQDICTKTEIVKDPTIPGPPPPAMMARPDPVPPRDVKTLPCEARPKPPMTTDLYCDIFQDYLENHDSDSARFSLGLTVRSVGEMIRFLGDLQYLQENIPYDDHHNIPVTLGWKPDCHDPLIAKKKKAGDTCLGQDGGALFRVNNSQGTPRFTLNYRGKTYVVAQEDRNDHTLEVLSIVSLLVNLNKTASDIRTTPVLQVVP